MVIIMVAKIKEIPEMKQSSSHEMKTQKENVLLKISSRSPESCPVEGSLCVGNKRDICSEPPIIPSPPNSFHLILILSSSVGPVMEKGHLN